MIGQTVNVTFNLDGNIYTGIAEIDKAMSKMNVTAKSSLKAFDSINKVAFKVNNILSATRTIVSGVTNTVQKFTAASRVQAEAETKLAAVMRNTMGAGREELQGILDLTAAQQKLGVIGDEVQLAGAQELATYLSKSETLKQLLPVMNDMVAQQYGLNASQQSAVGIATMMGKVMDGQVNALSRYGYKFTEAQEKILKFGNEEQRAATLAEVVSASVGGVNAALAATPDGAMQQVRNRMGDINERVGALFTSLRSALMPAIDQLVGFAERMLDGIVKHQDKITAGVKLLVDNMWVLVSLFGTLFAFQASKKASEMATALLDMKNKLSAATTALTARLTAMRAAIMRTAIAQKAAAVATKIWAGAQAAFNVIASLNPIGLIVAGITALIAAITLCVVKFETWGETVLTLMGPIGWAVASVVRHWDSLKRAFTDGGIIGGLKRIGLVLLDALLHPVQKLLELLSRIPGLGKLAGKGAEFIQEIRAKLDLTEAKPIDEPTAEAKTDPDSPLLAKAKDAPARSTALGIGEALHDTPTVATAGSGQVRSINISIDSLVREFTVQTNNMQQGAAQVRDMVARALTEAVNDVNYAI